MIKQMFLSLLTLVVGFTLSAQNNIVDINDSIVREEIIVEKETIVNSVQYEDKKINEYKSKSIVQRRYNDRYYLSVDASPKMNLVLLFYIQKSELERLQNIDGYYHETPISLVVFDLEKDRIVYDGITTNMVSDDDISICDRGGNNLIDDYEKEYLIRDYLLEDSVLRLSDFWLNVYTGDTLRAGNSVWLDYFGGELTNDFSNTAYSLDYSIAISESKDSLVVFPSERKVVTKDLSIRKINRPIVYLGISVPTNINHQGGLFKEGGSFLFEHGLKHVFPKSEVGFFFIGYGYRFQNLRLASSTSLYETSSVITHRFRVLTGQLMGGVQFTFGPQKKYFVMLQFQESYNAITKYTFREVDEVKQIVSGNLFLNRFNHELKAQIGSRSIGFTCAYRLNSLFKNGVNFGEVSPVSLGVEIRVFSSDHANR